MRLDMHLQLHQASTNLLKIKYGTGGLPHFYLKEEICQQYAVSLYK
jgi:hypothetical protein